MNKILLALAIGLALTSQQAKAEYQAKAEDFKIGLHIGTYHIDRSTNYNEFNPGVYVVYNSFTAGTYYNSEKKQSSYVGYTYEYGNFAITAGGISGYKKGLIPMLVPSYKIPNTNIRLAYLPNVPGVKHNTQALHLMIEF